MPTTQSQRNLIARMKLIPVDALIRDKSLLLIDDSIVRGTQLGETTEFLYQSGAKAVHIRPACPPLLFGCKYLNFSRSNSELDVYKRQGFLLCSVHVFHSAEAQLFFPLFLSQAHSLSLTTLPSLQGLSLIHI